MGSKNGKAQHWAFRISPVHQSDQYHQGGKVKIEERIAITKTRHI